MIARLTTFIPGQGVVPIGINPAFVRMLVPIADTEGTAVFLGDDKVPLNVEEGIELVIARLRGEPEPETPAPHFGEYP
jgi:hypothetical protein